jgi:hypothetical protein
MKNLGRELLLNTRFGKELSIYAVGSNWFVDSSVISLVFLLWKIRKGSGREILASLWSMDWKNFRLQMSKSLDSYHVQLLK